jgi:signal recognition particle subunit SRP72
VEPLKPKAPRKSRIPKGVIPGITLPPDPERWIKKSERTRVETSGKKKKLGGATQGSAVIDSKALGGGGGKNKKRK